jgi:hypothetical protein
MTDQTTQAAVDETKAPAAPGAEVDSARKDGDDLDKILAEFDEGTKPAPAAAKPEPKAGEADDLKAAKDEVLSARDEIRQERFKKDMHSTVMEVRGDLPADFFDDRFVQAWIDARATDDPRLSKAWIERNSNPQQFKRVVGALSREFAKKYGKLPDKQATEDREAVTAAVRGASTKAPEGKAPDLSRLTDTEFVAEKEKLFG